MSRGWRISRGLDVGSYCDVPGEKDERLEVQEERTSRSSIEARVAGQGKA